MNLADALEANGVAMDRVLDDAMPDLEAAIAQTERELLSFVLELPEDADSWTAHQQRSLLVQLRHLTDRTRTRAGTALAADLRTGLEHAGPESLLSLERIVRAGARQFGNVQTLRLDVASVIAKSENTLLHRMGSIAARYGEELGGRIRRDLMVGILRGENLHQISSRLLQSSGMIRKLAERGPKALAEGAADFTRTRALAGAERIVRTELINGYEVVQLDGVREADREDPGYQKRWDAAHDRRLCPGCRELDEHVVGLDERFESAYYGSLEHSPAHASCFVPETRVAARVECALRAWYDGEIVDVETASGAHVAVTINHPMATTMGFVAAANLQQGDKVLGQRGDVWSRLRDVDEDHAPPRIDEVFRALRVTGLCSRRSATALDFHGDAAFMDREIDVVRSLGELRIDRETEALELALKLALSEPAVRHVVHARRGHLHPNLERVLHAALRIVGGFDLAKSLLLRHGGPLDRLSLGLPAQGNASALEPLTEEAARDARLVGELLEGLAGEVARGEAIDVIERRRSRSDLDPAAVKQPDDRLLRDGVFARELQHRFPTDVFADDVVSVGKRHFRGHVYDLQTATGWIVANGIYASNCRCAVVPWRRGWSL